MTLEERITSLSSQSELDRDEAERAFRELINGLNSGRMRAAERQEDGRWTVNAFVKQGILIGFKLGAMERIEGRPFAYFDKDTYPLKPLDISDGVRIVPGGSSIRTGSYVAPGVVCMPPMYINVGAYVDEGSMVDSHALVGSCAQIGRNVHLSAAAQIGGVLEPIGAVPVIVEDDVFVGGGCGIYEGCIIRERAVLAPGVILTGATKIYDLVNETIVSRSENGGSLEIPAGAVVVPGARSADSEFASEHGLSLYAPMIVKYRDEKTAASTTLETALR
jgi:2,3,4,5-tetrahydropyridine-2,6-dicarboxylate N-succinyltransferase